jgi:protein-L-isoaspartate(D-aspartate) O-methyltransferase
MARALLESGRTPSPAVQAAFRAVPRHLFVPGLAPVAAYQDEALVIKYGQDGLPISSSSQPAMMAIMLEQLGLEPGHRVLEIGTGTGYNAAVMAHVVGPSGFVTTIDIDPDLIERARASLTAAGYDSVRASCGDGGYGDPAEAPFDRIIVTAGAWDIAPAWLDQLAPGGRLVLPLGVRSIQLSLGLERRGDHWMAGPAFRCGFVRMAGAFGDPESFRPLAGSAGLYVQVDDGRPVDGAALATALAGPGADIGTGVRATSRDQIADLDLWLTLNETGLDRLTIMETAASGGGPLLPLGGLASLGGGPADLGVAGLAGAQSAPAAAEAAGGPAAEAYPGEVVLRGYGPGGPALATHLARQVPAWAQLGRPGAADLCLSVFPADGRVTVPAGQILLTRPHVRIAAGWPVR